MHPHVFEFRADQADAEEENPHVVLRAFRAEGTLVFRTRAFRGFGEGRDGEAEDDVGFHLSGVVRSVEKPEFDRSHPPHVVEVNRAVPRPIVVVRLRVRVAEPRAVQGFACGRFGGFEAGYESALGAARVVLKAAFQGSGGLQNQLFLLVENPREVGDLAGVEIADSDVDVLAGAFRRFRSGVPKFPNHSLKRVEVVPFQNRCHHLGASGAVGQAAVADRLPVATVRSDHRPFVVSASGVVDRSADHAVDRFNRSFAADVRVLEFRPEGKFLRRLHRVGHFGLRCFAC